MIRLVGIACAAFALFGCMGGSSPPDRHYRLEAPAPRARLPEPTLPGTLIVDRPRGAGVVDQRPLLARSAGSSPELRQYAYSLWLDVPSAMLQREIADYLREAGFAERVITSDLVPTGDFVLQGRLLRLERVRGAEPRVELALELALLGGPHRELLRHGSYRAERPVRDGTSEAAVRAFNQALGEVLERFVADAAGSTGR